MFVSLFRDTSSWGQGVLLTFGVFLHQCFTRWNTEFVGGDCIEGTEPLGMISEVTVLETSGQAVSKMGELMS